jgi:RND superfamily putative drug exporter
MARPDKPTDDSGRSKLLKRVADLTTRRPLWVLLVWMTLMGPLALIGNGLDDKVSTRPIYVEGSDAERAHQIAVREFGGEDTMVLMLRGPRAAVDRQGRALVGHLEGIPQTLAISPWSSSGSINGLRPSPRVAAILVTIGEVSDGSTSDAVPEVERQVERTVRGPVRVSIAGGPAIVDSLRSSIKEAATAGELLSIPVLLIVLLLVCRSVLAALMPLMVGGLVVAATKGILTLIATKVSIDPMAEGAAGMFGLALGVDYALLVVSRFREEIEKDGDLQRSVHTTVRATGRSIVPAGCGLVLAMMVSLQVLPGSFVSSLTIAVSAASILSVLSALFATPAILMLLGPRLDRWSLPRRRRSGSFALGWSRLSRRPGFVLGLIFALMLCGAWALTLDTNTGGASQLPPDDPGRIQQEAIERELGPGWTAPFEIVVNSGGQPITTKHRLDALADFQHQVEKDPGVEAMAGFASLERTTNALGSTEQTLAKQERGVTKLHHGLARVQDGSGQTTDGFLGGAEGARQLGSAVGQSEQGTGKLANGLQSSAKGSTRLSGGLDQTSEGSGKLTDATAEASDGAGQLSAKVKTARKQTAEAVGSSRTLKNALREGEDSLGAAPLATTEEQLRAAWGALQQMTAGRSDAQYAAAVEAVRQANLNLTGAEPDSEEEEGAAPAGVAGGVEDALDQFSLGLYLAARQDKSGTQARDGMVKLEKASAKLDRGLVKLLDHSRELSSGIDRLSRNGEQLPPGLRRLTDGAQQLLAGLGKIENGTGNLAGGLEGGAQKSRLLTGAVGKLRGGTEGQNGRLTEQSPGIFRSGYFYLAGLDGSRPDRRNQAGFLVNIGNGGSTARMLVIPKDPLASDGVAATGDRIAADAADLARETHSEVLVGGLSSSLVDLNEVLREQVPFARIVLSLVTIAVLLLVTRSLVLPLIAALLNLLTVSASLGLMALLFDGSLLGGPGYVDTSVIPASVILTFGLAIDYEVFIFARIREEYLRTGSTRAAIDDGLAHTAHVISGAALIMIAVFLTFSLSPLMNLRNLGVSQAIGVFIDAFIIRFVILPATMRALNDRCWWIPKWLDKLLPGQSLRRPETAG